MKAFDSDPINLAIIYQMQNQLKIPSAETDEREFDFNIDHKRLIDLDNQKFILFRHLII